MMRRTARLVPGIGFLFAVLMAVLLNSPALFYMSTALLAMMGAARLQAWLSVRGLRIERTLPPAAVVGERVTVNLTVWSEKRLKRPLVSIVDGLPSRLDNEFRTPSLPVAPSYDQPIPTQYRFRPMRRGKFSWGRLRVDGTDALGLVTMSREYRTEPAEITIYPVPIPVSLPVPIGSGWGVSELETGRRRGAGLEPRGVREYSDGDPLRYVHWTLSARAGTLMVKEFEVGSGLCAYFVIQRVSGSDRGVDAGTTLEAMCGHAAYLAEDFLSKGARVLFPTLENTEEASWSEVTRKQEMDELLASVQADQKIHLSEELRLVEGQLQEGGTLLVMLTVQDPRLPEFLRGQTDLRRICLIYDPFDYEPWRPEDRLPSAAEPDYLAQLRSAGVETVLMPKVERLQ